jgi:hypothetical protein
MTKAVLLVGFKLGSSTFRQLSRSGILDRLFGAESRGAQVD